MTAIAASMSAGAGRAERPAFTKGEAAVRVMRAYSPAALLAGRTGRPRRLFTAPLIPASTLLAVSSLAVQAEQVAACSWIAAVASAGRVPSTYASLSLSICEQFGFIVLPRYRVPHGR